MTNVKTGMKLVIPPTPDRWREAIHNVLVTSESMAARDLTLDPLATIALLGVYLGGAYDLDPAELARMYDVAIRESATLVQDRADQDNGISK